VCSACQIGKILTNIDMAALTCSGQVFLWGNYKDNEGFLGFSGAQTKGQELPISYPKLEGMCDAHGVVRG
jgi:hypothetical protein